MAIEDIVINATAQQIEDMATRQISQEITEDSSENELASAKAVYDVVKNMVGGGGGGTGGGLEPLIVTIDETTGEANHSAEDVLSQIAADGNVYLYQTGGYLPVSYADEEYAEFEIISPDGKTKTVHRIYSDRSVEEYSVTFATKDELGDLDAALANILDYAQSLTGGGES